MRPAILRAVDLSKRIFRVTAYLTFVAFVFLCLGAHTVWGKAQSEALHIGSGLAAMGGVVGPAYTVTLNGQPVQVSSVSVSASVTEVLDHFQQLCRDQTGPAPDEVKELDQKLKTRTRRGWGLTTDFGIMRKEAEGEGIVACLARDSEHWSLGPAVSEFLKTRNLQALGNLRYVVARRATADSTLVVTARTDGPILLDDILPRSGDAHGEDPVSGRPPDSRRLMTAGVDGSPFRVNIYESKVAAEGVLAHYDESLPQSGWQPLEGGRDHLAWGRAYSRAGVDLMVFTGKGDKGATIVSIVTMPPPLAHPPLIQSGP